MTNRDYTDELEYLEWYDISDEEKIEFIEKLYRLAHMNFNNFIQNNWQIIYWE